MLPSRESTSTEGGPNKMSTSGPSQVVKSTTCQSSAVSGPCPDTSQSAWSSIPQYRLANTSPNAVDMAEAGGMRICLRTLQPIFRAASLATMLCTRRLGEVPSLFAETAAVTKAAGSFHMRTAARHADWRLAPGATSMQARSIASRERSPEAASRRAGLKSGSQNANSPAI